MSAAGTWDTGAAHRPGDDVLLPLELDDLARTRPPAHEDGPQAAAWLLRKAALLERLGMTHPPSAATAFTLADRARSAAGGILTGQLDAIAAHPLDIETKHREEAHAS